MIVTERKLGSVWHTTLVITVSNTNPTWSAPKSGLYKRAGGYSWKFINSSSWSRMWTGRPTNCGSIPGRRNTFTCTAQRPYVFCGQLASSSMGVRVPSVLQAWCEVTMYFRKVAKLNKRGAISPLPTCIRLSGWQCCYRQFHFFLF
jgi:hypothetical protein